MGTEIRMAYRAKYKMLSVVLECFSKLQVKIFYQYTGMHTHFLFCLVHQYGRLGYGGAKQVTGILFCMPKMKEPTMKRSTFSFFHWNRKSKIGDSAIISSLPFTPETKMSSGSLYPTILNLPHPTLLHILVELLLVRIQILLCCFKSFL